MKGHDFASRTSRRNHPHATINRHHNSMAVLFFQFLSVQVTPKTLLQHTFNGSSALVTPSGFCVNRSFPRQKIIKITSFCLPQLASLSKRLRSKTLLQKPFNGSSALVTTYQLLCQPQHSKTTNHQKHKFPSLSVHFCLKETH